MQISMRELRELTTLIEERNMAFFKGGEQKGRDESQAEIDTLKREMDEELIDREETIQAQALEIETLKTHNAALVAEKGTSGCTCTKKVNAAV